MTLESVQKTSLKKEMVNHPSHYNAGKYEVIDVIEDWGLGFNDGNAVKYIARHEHKGKALEDLKKARWYIDRLIEKYTQEEPASGPQISGNVLQAPNYNRCREKERYAAYYDKPGKNIK